MVLVMSKFLVFSLPPDSVTDPANGFLFLTPLRDHVDPYKKIPGLVSTNRVLILTLRMDYGRSLPKVNDIFLYQYFLV